MGVSIFSGAITTFGAGIFLLCASTIPYNKFGILLTVSITFSFFIAMLFFGALSHIMGPEEGFGDVTCSKQRE
jgi:amino acid transporter